MAPPLPAFERIVNLLQHKIDKDTAICGIGTAIYGIVISLLVGINHILNGKMLENGVQFSQNQRFPEATRPPVSVAERVYVFKFIVEYNSPISTSVLSIFLGRSTFAFLFTVGTRAANNKIKSTIDRHITNFFVFLYLD